MKSFLLYGKDNFLSGSYAKSEVKCKIILFSKGSDKIWWEGEGGETVVPEEINCEEDAFDRDEFEGRELSVVLEETEVEESESDYSSGVDIDKVIKRIFVSFQELRLFYQGCDRGLHDWC